MSVPTAPSVEQKTNVLDVKLPFTATSSVKLPTGNPLTESLARRSWRQTNKDSLQKNVNKGNTAFKAGRIAEAIVYYTHAIALEDTNRVYYSNRSAAYLQLDDATLALKDAETCIELDPHFSKGYSRKGAALHALECYEDSIAAYQEGLLKFPNDEALKKGLKLAERDHRTAELSKKVNIKLLNQELVAHCIPVITVGLPVGASPLNGQPNATFRNPVNMYPRGIQAALRQTHDCSNQPTESKMEDIVSLVYATQLDGCLRMIQGVDDAHHWTDLSTAWITGGTNTKPDDKVVVFWYPKHVKLDLPSGNLVSPSR